MLEGVLAFRKPTSPPKKLVLEDTGMMDGFIHIRALAQHPMWNNIKVGVIWLVLWLVLHLMFLMFLVMVVWVLGPPTFTYRKFIVGLMVVISCHIRVGVIHQ